MSYGPNPWQQAHWDWRAAGNFVCGGAGSGLIVCAVASDAPAMTLLAGLALVGLGLFSVWLEIGRPLRALNVFLNPRTSWMSREAIVAVLLAGAGTATLLGVAGMAWITAACALAFVYCQARMLRAARGIPAWRAPRIVPLGLATALAEGAGLLFALAPVRAAADGAWISAFGVLLLVRLAAWLAYRKQLPAALRDGANLVRAGRVLVMVGTLLPVILLAILAPGVAGDALAIALAIGAGLMSCAAGGFMKFTLITGAGYNQGFALEHLPVRGVHR